MTSKRTLIVLVACSLVLTSQAEARDKKSKKVAQPVHEQTEVTQDSHPVKKSSDEPSSSYEYPKYSRTYNIMINPLGILFGQYGGSFNMAVSDSMTLGLGATFQSFSTTTATFSGTSLRTKTTTVSAFSVTGRMNYYLSGPRLSDSWYLSPMVSYEKVGADNVVVDVSGINFGALVGYHWVYTSGFNMMLGAGLSYSTVSGTVAGIDMGAISGLRFAAEFNLGWAF